MPRNALDLRLGRNQRSEERRKEADEVGTFDPDRGGVNRPRGASGSHGTEAVRSPERDGTCSEPSHPWRRVASPRVQMAFGIDPGAITPPYCAASALEGRQ